MPRTFACTNHDAVWPTGVASVVVADNEPQARELLMQALADHGLNPDTNNDGGMSLELVEIEPYSARVLADGDY